MSSGGIILIGTLILCFLFYAWLISWVLGPRKATGARTEKGKIIPFPSHRVSHRLRRVSGESQELAADEAAESRTVPISRVDRFPVGGRRRAG